MELQQAKQIADGLVKDLLPFCERAEIAGSIRREKPEVKDIEIVAVPKLLPITDMFGASVGTSSAIEENIQSLLTSWNAYTIKNGEKYKMIALADHGIKLDLFIVTKESWGVQFVIRTGPSDFSHWLVTQKRFGGAMPAHAKVEGGRIIVANKPIETNEEIDVFNFLQIKMQEPKLRSAPKNFIK